jgi:sorbitol/mannitol transport system substrate-binding protein
MKLRIALGASLLAATLSGAPAIAATQLTIATVNNADMIRMQAMTSAFTAMHPDIAIHWVVLEENVLRQRVTTDIATKSGEFDIMTIGNYEVPIWAKQGWLLPLTDFDDSYDMGDLLPKIRASLSYKNTLYAAPFYGESTMTYYRKDLFEKAGLTMPDHPNWDFIEQAAKALTDKSHQIYGICLRGQAGWGENINIITAMANSFGARWFDMKWNAQFDQPAWHKTLSEYVHLMRDYGEPGGSSAGATQALALFATGHCGMFVDSTVFASSLSDPKQSDVAGKVGFAFAPDAGLSKSAVTLWSWALGIPASTRHKKAAEEFISWATSRDYAKLIEQKYGVENAPPGTRTSLYHDPAYLAAAPFAGLTLEAIDAADPDHPTVQPVPYVGVQFVAIPEFQAIGNSVGQQFAGAVAGTESVDQALKSAQTITTQQMQQSGYTN